MTTGERSPTLPNRVLAMVAEITGSQASEHPVAIFCGDGSRRMAELQSINAAVAFMGSGEPARMCREAAPTMPATAHMALRQVRALYRPAGRMQVQIECRDGRILRGEPQLSSDGVMELEAMPAAQRLAELAPAVVDLAEDRCGSLGLPVHLPAGRTGLQR